jgi:hypothetical protein
MTDGPQQDWWQEGQSGMPGSQDGEQVDGRQGPPESAHDAVPLFGDPTHELFGSSGTLSPKPAEPERTPYVGRHRAPDQ